MNNGLLTNDPQTTIKKNLSYIKGKNIITYMKYINLIVKGKDIRDLFKLFNINLQNQIRWYWGQLSLYEDFDKIKMNKKKFMILDIMLKNLIIFQLMKKLKQNIQIKW